MEARMVRMEEQFSLVAVILMLTILPSPTIQGPLSRPTTHSADATEACNSIAPYLQSLEELMKEMSREQCSDAKTSDQCLAPTVALLQKSCLGENRYLDKQCVVDLYQNLKSTDHQACLCGGLRRLEELSFMVQGVVCSGKELRGGRGVGFLQGLLGVIQANSDAVTTEAPYKWGYGSGNGPHTWATLGGFTHCAGLQQTPVSYTWSGDLPSDRKAEPSPLKVTGWEFEKMYLKNNGHGAKIEVTPKPGNGILYGGPLNGTYTILQFHLHWASEHTYNGMAYPLELHIVHTKDGVDDPVYTPMGLSVLGFMFKEGSSVSAALKPLVDAMPSIVESGSKVELKDFKLGDLVDPVMSSPVYGYYKGSLTTPPCTEVVEWINFLNPLDVGETDLAAFKTLKDDDGNVIKSNTRLGNYGDFDARGGVYYDASA